MLFQQSFLSECKLHPTFTFAITYNKLTEKRNIEENIEVEGFYFVFNWRGINLVACIFSIFIKYLYTIQ